MKVTCKVCNKEFDCEPKTNVFCGTEVTSQENYPRAEVNPICPACSEDRKTD